MDAAKFRYSVADLERQFSGQAVTIVGNEPTGMEFQPTRDDKWLWTINNGFMRPHGADLTFVMDDLQGPAWSAHKHRDEWFQMLREAPIPVMTAVSPPDFPACVDYPLADVLQRTGGIGYFAETLSYMIAWAIAIEVKALRFHGADYYADDRRAQRACTEFWLGKAQERGIHIEVNPYSKLMVLPPLDCVNRHVQGFYGYTEERFPLQIKNGSPHSPERVQRDEQTVQSEALAAGL